MFPLPALLADLVPCKVLVVEDNADGRESLRMLLSLCGCRVETAADGAEGVRKAIVGHPHIALVDIGLPVMDGREVARRIRALGRRVILVACTAYEEGYGGARAKESPFDAWLVKPVALPDLLLWIKKACAALN